MHEIDYVVMASHSTGNSNRTRADAHFWATVEPRDRKKQRRAFNYRADRRSGPSLALAGERRKPHHEVYAVRSDAGFSLRSEANPLTEL
jgi:hypothetical protein